jgi:hypothetical protein
VSNTLVDALCISCFSHAGVLALTGDWTIAQPCFFAAAHKDAVYTPIRFQPMMEKYAKDLTIFDYYTGHWLQLEASGQLNTEFEAWLRNKVNPS